MNISPRSTGGINSSPTAPKPTIAMAKRNVPAQNAATRPPRERLQGSTRCVYQVRVSSNFWPNQSTTRHGFQCERNAHRPASVGVIVNETKRDVSVEITTTIANSLI